MERRFIQMMISADLGHKYGIAIWGSHPRTDPLFSTRHTSIVHYGSEFDRFERTAYLAGAETAMRYLRVCWESSIGANCGECEKCVRTMAAMEVLGILDQCSTFPANAFSLRKLENIYSGALGVYYQNLRDHALEHGRSDIAAAIDKSLRYSRRVDRWLQLPRLRRANSWLKRSMPVLWRLLLPIRFALKRIIEGLSGARV